MENEKTVMLREIGMQPAFVESNIDPMLAYMRQVLSTRDPGTLGHGFMIGCGDSYCAALAVRQFMMKATGRFVATVYGVGFANLIFIPISNKIKKNIFELTRYKKMILEGGLLVSSGLTPYLIEQKLTSYMNNNVSDNVRK